MVLNHAKITPFTCMGRMREKTSQGTPPKRFGVTSSVAMTKPTSVTNTIQNTELCSQIKPARS